MHMLCGWSQKGENGRSRVWGIGLRGVSVPHRVCVTVQVGRCPHVGSGSTPVPGPRLVDSLGLQVALAAWCPQRYVPQSL